MNNKDLKKRIISISYKYKLSHLGSCLTALPILKEIYDKKKKDEKFFNDGAHNSLALYVVLEHNGGRNAEEIFKHHGVHCDKCDVCGLDCSGGSLGISGSIALGAALANRLKTIWCLTTDGALQEGVWWETLRIAKEQKVTNFKIIANCNGFGAYKAIDTNELEKRIKAFGFPVDIRRTNSNQLPFLQGIDAHYKILNKEEYEQVMDLLV